MKPAKKFVVREVYTLQGESGNWGPFLCTQGGDSQTALVIHLCGHEARNCAPGDWELPFYRIRKKDWGWPEGALDERLWNDLYKAYYADMAWIEKHHILGERRFDVMPDGALLEIECTCDRGTAPSHLHYDSCPLKVQG